MIPSAITRRSSRLHPKGRLLPGPLPTDPRPATLAFEDELEAMRPLVRRRSHGHCEARLPGCRRRATCVHHRKRRSQGGDNSLENLLDLCARCHRVIHDEPTRARSCGLLLRSTDDPRSTLVRSDLWTKEPRSERA